MWAPPRGAALGFCNYLGQVRNEDGSASEVYGKQLEAEITVEIRGRPGCGLPERL